MVVLPPFYDKYIYDKHNNPDWAIAEVLCEPFYEDQIRLMQQPPDQILVIPRKQGERYLWPRITEPERVQEIVDFIQSDLNGWKRYRGDRSEAEVSLQNRILRKTIPLELTRENLISNSCRYELQNSPAFIQELFEFSKSKPLGW